MSQKVNDLFIYQKNNQILNIVQTLQSKNSKSLLNKNHNIMQCKDRNQQFYDYLINFFYVLKISDSFEIIKTQDIITKCVLIEKNNVFYISPSLNLCHHS